MKSNDSVKVYDYINQLRAETNDIIQQIIELTYFMRGSMQYHTLMTISVPERRMVSDFLNVRLKDELKKPPGTAIY